MGCRTSLDRFVLELRGVDPKARRGGSDEEWSHDDAIKRISEASADSLMEELLNPGRCRGGNPSLLMRSLP